MKMADDGWRSLLYVPANKPKFIEKAGQRGADAVILDLEDSVPAGEKATARQGLADAIALVVQSGTDVLVRINRPLRDAVGDLEAAVRPGVKGLVVSKVDGPSHVRLLDELVGELENERGMPVGAIRFALVIETPQAWLQMAEIFTASTRNAAAILGSEDFALACDTEPLEETLLLPKQQLIITARAHGLAPLGLIATIADYSDTEALRLSALRSRRFGFAGATCIHPNQVQAVKAAFEPSALELEEARKALLAYDEALQRGEGAVAVDGKMIDAPVAARARLLLARMPYKIAG